MKEGMNLLKTNQNSPIILQRCSVPTFYFDPLPRNLFRGCSCYLVASNHNFLIEFWQIIWGKCHVPGDRCSEHSPSCVHTWRGLAGGTSRCSISKVSDLYGSCSPLSHLNACAPFLTADKHVLFLSPPHL